MSYSPASNGIALLALFSAFFIGFIFFVFSRIEIQVGAKNLDSLDTYSQYLPQIDANDMGLQPLH
ncbi:MAG: hypothetical protein R3B52_01220 [Candidatus Paceibacterota bacterium]